MKKNNKIRRVRFEVDGRRATLDDTYYLDELKDIFSFSAPGAAFSPAYKQWVRTSRGYAEDPENSPPPSGWNGKISMLKNGMLGVGLLLGSDKLLDAGFKLKITKWRHKPEVECRKAPKIVEGKYSYQAKCVQAMIDCIPAYGGGLVVAATGTGKTKIAADFCKRVRGQILFVVDQVDLLYQSQAEIAEWLGEKVGVVGNSKFEPRRVTVATIQTLHKHQETLRFRHWQKEVDIVIIDEVHVQMSRRNFSVVESIKPQAVIGLTATLELRKKNVAMKAMDICGPVVFKFPIKEGVKQGILSKGVVVQVVMQESTREREWIENKDPRKKGRDEDDYEYHVVNNRRLHLAVTQLTQRCVMRGYATAVLVDRVKHVTRMQKRLKKLEPRMFYGAISTHERKASIKKFEKGKADLIIANRVFTKGINVKRLDLAIDAAMRQSKNDAQQKYGRLVRLHDDKKGAIFISVVVLPAMHKVADAHRSAFKSVGTPFIRIPWTNAKDVLKTAEKQLRKALRP